MYYFSEMNNDATISSCFKQYKYWTKKSPKTEADALKENN